MAFFKYSSIYDVLVVFKRGFCVPDGTLNADSSVSTKAKDIIYLILFEATCIILGFFAFNSNRGLLESNSKLLDGGINFAVKTGFILSFSGRLVLFEFRHKFWDIVKLLEKVDLLVKLVPNPKILTVLIFIFLSSKK
jgi:hypothetical protein